MREPRVVAGDGLGRGETPNWEESARGCIRQKEVWACVSLRQRQTADFGKANPCEGVVTLGDGGLAVLRRA